MSSNAVIASPAANAPSHDVPLLSREDAEELAARRAAEARLHAKLSGWKPLTMWYAFWAVMIAIASFSGLASGNVGAFFVGLAACAACVKYAHYLYHGGRRRVWFFIW